MIIIADDLSGAADCAITCVAAGHEVSVALTGDLDMARSHVVAIDADTRGLSPAEAQLVARRIGDIHARPGRTVFRKIDSTLRGHLAIELAATLAARRVHGPAVIVLAPAFPVMGRTTRGGIQYLHRLPLEETEIWRYEKMPGRAILSDMLAVAGLRASVLPLDVVRNDGLATALLAAEAGVDVLVCDAETDMDLARIVTAGAELGDRAIWAGSAGLARFVSGSLPSGATRPVPRVPVAQSAGPILFVIASLSAVSARQVAMLAECADVAHVRITPTTLRAGAGTPDWRRARDELSRVLTGVKQDGKDVVVSLAPEPGASLADGASLSVALGALLAPWAGHVGALVASGGETARAILLAFGATGLRLVGEVQPGVPVAIAEGAVTYPVITKAGAFGDEATLMTCRALLKQQDPAPAN
ncbi:four-carbon acid sugar kinase family protein [Gluconacetobacter tumulisoli]|uniref:Four-carbon acid sugar kinase family protein n=1 Tax=Gluconacetobacter tumulisoli TaxID=1286189 RepID=A0A7W4PM11_9PROT|nr:four-carbon acid sugar kinase family protein [Gluconacetobacter tumulisoli]MBB2203032.1 four-carbon acid sugar kinase family protein [Gluconacetobacter tumulisoli]